MAINSQVSYCNYINGLTPANNQKKKPANNQNSFKSIPTENLGFLTKSFITLGDKIGENARLGIDTVGAIFLQPLAIILGPGARTQEDKDKRKYQNLRQPVSAALKLIITFAVSWPIGKKLAGLALAGKYTNHMNAKFFIDTNKANTISELIQKIGGKPFSQEIKNKLDEAFNLSKSVRESIDKGLQKEVAIDEYLAQNKTIDISDKKLFTIMDKVTFIKNQAEKYMQDLPLQKLIEEFDILKKESTTLKSKATPILKDIINSGELNNKQLTNFKNIFKVEHSKSYDAYQQIFQWCITILMQPVVAYSINTFFPPFAELIAPNLVKTMRGYNKSK